MTFDQRTDELIALMNRWQGEGAGNREICGILYVALELANNTAAYATTQAMIEDDKANGKSK